MDQILQHVCMYVCMYVCVYVCISPLNGIVIQIKLAQSTENMKTAASSKFVLGQIDGRDAYESR